ncbi:uncharacterized protein LOC124253264 [Haliotis rubra]|uniref:uncharacterized protein LOC124253264 n=1 Tax=Haliotis rubra TaxID=36100 RepID=UPI001EE588ED|nr:uncharacterized protein LOC124253264 [Haliotis rubra]
MIFLHGLALAVYEFQRYLKYRDDQRLEMLKREADQQAAEAYAAQEKLMVDNAMEADRLAVAAAVEKAEAAAAAADAGYAAWKEALIFAALEAERVSAYSSKNAGTPANVGGEEIGGSGIGEGPQLCSAGGEESSCSSCLGEGPVCCSWY